MARKKKESSRSTRRKPKKRRIEEEDERLPWERMHGESDKAWEAFKAYRDMGLSRSCERVSIEVKKCRRLIHRWSAENNWRHRVEAWDVEQDRVERAANLAAIKKMHERHAATGRLLMGKGLQKIQKIDPATLYPATCVKLIELGCKLEARAMGEPEERTQSDVTTHEGKPVQYIVFGGHKIEF